MPGTMKHNLFARLLPLLINGGVSGDHNTSLIAFYVYVVPNNITHLQVGTAVRIKVIADPMKGQIESRNRVQIPHDVRRGCRRSDGRSRNQRRRFSFHLLLFFNGARGSVGNKEDGLSSPPYLPYPYYGINKGRQRDPN